MEEGNVPKRTAEWISACASVATEQRSSHCFEVWCATPSLRWEMQIANVSPMAPQMDGSSAHSSVTDECITIMAQHLQQCRVAAGCGGMPSVRRHCH